MKFFRYNPALLVENQQLATTIQQLDEIDQLSSTIESNLDKEIHVPKDVLDSFKIKDTLNPEIWTDKEINQKVRKQLLKIANDFIKNLDLPKTIVIKDVIFTGSLANYNWSKFSDIDLHIIMDFRQLESDSNVTKEFFLAQKKLWNQEHDIKTFDFPIEIYVQDIADKLVATAVYSLLHNKWIKKPIREKFKIDKQTIKNKAGEFINQLKTIRDDYKNEKFNKVIKNVKILKDKIKQMRNAGLENGGEFSNENIVFKVLRRTSFMDVLDSFKAKAYDQLMSVVEKINLDEGEIIDKTKFITSQNDDEIIINAMYKGQKIAYIIMLPQENAYWKFNGEMTEEEYYNVFPDDEFMEINVIKVLSSDMRGKGLAKKLMQLAIQKAKKMGYKTMFLNAKPIDSNGLNLNDLVGFYKSFGFKPFMNQGSNVLMVQYFKKPSN